MIYIFNKNIYFFETLTCFSNNPTLVCIKRNTAKRDQKIKDFHNFYRIEFAQLSYYPAFNKEYYQLVINTESSFYSKLPANILGGIDWLSEII